MATDLKTVTVAEIEAHLKVDSDGNLYWRGKRLRSGGWTLSERIAFGGAIIAAIGVGVAILDNWTAIAALAP